MLINAPRYPAIELPAQATFSGFSYGEHFDDSAKARMISGCRLLQPWLDELARRIAGDCAEFGPFLNPLLEPGRFPGSRITYVDADSGVISRLQERYRANARALCIDLNAPARLPEQLAAGEPLGRAAPRFNALVVSQILNYIDHERFFGELSGLATDGALLFVNNVIDYGIPELFHARRPRSDREIIVTLGRLGWSVRRVARVPSPFAQQPYPRLLVIAEKTARPA
jgi:hypothetical protein